MNNDTKKLRALLICFWVMIIATWLVCIISGTKLNIVVHNERLIALGKFIDNYIVLKYGLSFITYYFNMILIEYTILRERIFKYKPIIISIFITCVWILKLVFNKYVWCSFFDFSYILLTLFICKNKWLNSIIEMLKAFLFSLLCAFIKTYNNIDFVDLPSLITLIMMIDYYILFIVNYIYVRKEGYIYEKLGRILWKTKGLENYKRSFRNFVSRCNCNYRSFISSLKTNGWKIYCSLIFSIITYGSILIVSYFYNKMLEISICIVCFHIFRNFDEKSYHATTSIKCFAISLIVFSVMNSVSLPIEKSIVSTIMLSYILTKIMFLVQDYIDYLKEKKIDKSLVRLENMSIEQLKEMFSEYSDNDIHAIYTCLHKDRNMNYECIALKYNMSRMTLYRIMKKVKERYQLLIK